MQKGMFSKFQEIITKPSGFFKSLDEKSIKPAFYYSIVFGLFYTILAIGVGFLMDATFYSTFWFSVAIYWVMSTFVLNFLWAGILHLFIKLFKGKEGFSKTYQLFVYSSTPNYMLGWIPYVSLVGSIWSIVLLIKSTMTMHKMSKRNAIWLYSILLVLIILIAAGVGVWMASSLASAPTA